MDKVRPELQRMRVDLGSVTRHPDNARTHDLPRIRESLDLNGQYKPILVQKSTSYVIAGNGTHEAAEELGWDRIAVRVLDVTDEEAKRILLVDNRTSDVAGYDDDALVKLLSELSGYDEGLAGTGYDLDDLDDLIASLDAIPEIPAGDVAAPPVGSDVSRETSAGEGDRTSYREVVLLYSDDDAREFRGNVDVLKERWELETVAEVVLRAVEECAAGNDETE